MTELEKFRQYYCGSEEDRELLAIVERFFQCQPRSPEFFDLIHTLQERLPALNPRNRSDAYKEALNEIYVQLCEGRITKFDLKESPPAPFSLLSFFTLIDVFSAFGDVG